MNARAVGLALALRTNGRRCGDLGNDAHRIHVRQHVEHAVTSADSVLGGLGDVVALDHGQRSVDLKVGIHDDHVAHLARADVVYAEYSGRF